MEHIQGYLSKVKFTKKGILTLKDRCEYYLSITLVSPMNSGQSFESIIKLDEKIEGLEIDYKLKRPSEKEIYKSSIVMEAALKVSLFQVKKKKKNPSLLFKLLSTAMITGVGFITGNASTLIIAAVSKDFISSVFKSAAVSKKLKPVEIANCEISTTNLKSRIKHNLTLTTTKNLLLSTETVKEGEDDLVEKRTYLKKGFGICEVAIKSNKVSDNIYA